MFNISELITNFIPYEWIYRGEGNCNIVLSFPKFRKILRIRKIDRPRTLIEWVIVWISDFFYWCIRKNVKDELRDLKFYSFIMRPLIGRKYTSVVNQVIIDRKQLQILENELNKYRPGFRKDKILQYDRAALFDDFAFLSIEECDLPFKVTGNTFAVEIKPKQGWRPYSEKHFPKCLFCMNQYLKMEKKQIRQFSKYCPEDLFSGVPKRMKSALKSLIEVPQNNFKIFRNGIPCYGENIETLFDEIILEIFETSEEVHRLQEEFCELIRQCLTTNLYNINTIENCTKKLFCEWNEVIKEKKVDTILPKGCVLRQILSAQMLDTEEDIYNNTSLNTNYLEDWKYVNMLLNKIDRSTCLKCTIMTLSDTNKELDLNFIPYMISSIANDCSLMITLRKIKDNIGDNLETKNIIKTHFGYYIMNIGVFDLYPKPLSTIKKHRKRNIDIFRAYLDATETSDTAETQV